jgi:hypothetical protein
VHRSIWATALLCIFAILGPIALWRCAIYHRCTNSIWRLCKKLILQACKISGLHIGVNAVHMCNHDHVQRCRTNPEFSKEINVAMVVRQGWRVSPVEQARLAKALDGIGFADPVCRREFGLSAARLRAGVASVATTASHPGPAGTGLPQGHLAKLKLVSIDTRRGKGGAPRWPECPGQIVKARKLRRPVVSRTTPALATAASSRSAAWGVIRRCRGQAFGGDGRLPQHEIDGPGQPAALIDALGQRGAGRCSGLQPREPLQAGAGGFGDQGQEDPGPRRVGRTGPGRGVAPEPRQADRTAGSKRRGGAPEGEGGVRKVPATASRRGAGGRSPLTSSGDPLSGSVSWLSSPGDTRA